MDIKREPGKKLILEIGANINPQAQYLYPDDKILIMDIDKQLKPDIVMDAGKMNFVEKFDAILASHVLEHFPYFSVIDVMKRWANALVVGGELHILVPSWEWSARQVLSETPSPALFGHTFAGQTTEWDLHRCMFTMLRLRGVFETVGLSVVTATTTEYTLMINKQEQKAEQHYVAGVKK
jgi:predicted SAM-dependent methyltransferase